MIAGTPGPFGSPAQAAAAASIAWAVAKASLGILVSVAALSVAVRLTRGLLEEFAAVAPRPKVVPCGLVGADGRPCMLPRHHREHEHATAWFDAKLGSREERYRWDDNDEPGGGRIEYRYVDGMLPRVPAELRQKKGA